MKKIQRNTKSLLVLAALTASSSAATVTYVGPGNLDSAAAWGGTFPGAGDIGIVDINAAWPSTAAATNLSAGGDLIIGSSTATNIILTAGIDIVGSVPTSVTFNNVTVNVNDDIFTGGAGGNFIFNPGSITVVRDDFEANAGGTITVNGGMHTLTSAVNNSNFGAQNNSTLNFLGGTVTGLDLFRTTAGASLTIGGDATAVGAAGSTVNFVAGSVAFNSDWTGSLDLSGVADWGATLIAAGATLDGVAIDATSFGEDFVVVGNNVSLASSMIPEPSSLSLLGLSALFLAGRRSRK